MDWLPRVLTNLNHTPKNKKRVILCACLATALDRDAAFPYSRSMDDFEDQAEHAYPTLAASAGRKLLRFLLAGMTALLIVFITLLFMRFLVSGYDDRASNTLTRYISLPSFTIHRRVVEEEKPIKPMLEPELEIEEENNLAGAPTESELELSIDSPVAVPGMIEADIQLPGLGENESSEREKLRQIKEALTSGESG